MTDLVRTHSRELAASQPASLLPARPSRSLQRRVTREAEAAIVAQTRVQGQAFVASTAMAFITQLSADEVRAIQTAETTDPRFAGQLARRLGAVVDTFTQGAVNDVRSLQ